MDIALLTRGPGLYSTQRLVEAGNDRGHHMALIDHARCALLLDQRGPNLMLNGRFHEIPDVVIPRIGASVTALGASVIDQFELLRVPSTTSAAGLRLARDKWRCQQFLTGAGIDTPATLMCTDSAEARRCARTVGNYPLVVKVIEGTHGVGVSLAQNRYQLERICQAYLQFQPQVLIQEFIGEADGADIRAFVVGKRIIAAMERKAMRGEFRANMHLGATASPVELTATERKLVLQVTSLLDLEVAGIDILRSDRGPLIMEVNASPGLEGIEGATGIDIAGAIIELAAQKVQIALDKRELS
ncbi:MAG: RimK family alpha-L-glutamate ligase [Bacteroidota bacterium]